MFNNDNELRKCLKDNYSIEELSEEELKKRFITAFCEEKFHEEKVLSEADGLNWRLGDLLDIQQFTVIFEEMKEDLRYYDELDYIVINKKYIDNKLEIRKSIIHEVKHLHLKYCIAHKKEDLKFALNSLINEFNKNQRLILLDELNLMPVEVVAYEFTKYILKKWFNYEYHYPNDIYDGLLDIYIAKYYKYLLILSCEIEVYIS